MKDTFFFTHDFGARNDPKLQNVLMEHGCEGLGVFWCVVEQVYEQGGSLPLSNCKSIAFALHVECSVVESVVNDYALFESDGENFWSVSINNRLNKRAEIAQKRKNAAFNRWNNHQNNANAQDEDANAQDEDANAQDEDANAKHCNAIKEKERKEKERKENTSLNKEDKKVAAKAATLARKDEFYNSLVPFTKKYGKETIRKFFDYWSEMNRSETKMRFEHQPTWETSRRLVTWSNIDKIYSNARDKRTHENKRRGTQISATKAEDYSDTF